MSPEIYEARHDDFRSSLFPWFTCTGILLRGH